MRTLRAALASTTPLGSSTRLYESSRNACSATRNGSTPSAEIAVRFHPFCVYDSRRNACSFSPVLHNGAFDEALNAYPQFQTIGELLRRVPDGTTLEQRLAQLQAEANEIPGRHRELMAVRFYLQQILWATPAQWYQRSHKASNYSTVI